MTVVPEQAYLNNRDFYGRPIQPKYHPQANTDSTKVLIKIIIFRLVMMMLVCMFTWAWVNDSYKAKFQVDDINLTEFTLSPTNNTMYYNVAVNITFINPNNLVGIHYDKVKAILMYQGQKLMITGLEGFYLEHKEEKNNVNVEFRGERVLTLYNGNEKVVYESESKDGVYDIELKLIFKMRTRTLLLNSSKFNSKAECDLKVPLIISSKGKVPSLKYERTECSYYKEILLEDIDCLYPASCLRSF